VLPELDLNLDPAASPIDPVTTEPSRNNCKAPYPFEVKPTCALITTNTFELVELGVIDAESPVAVYAVFDVENVSVLVELTTCTTDPLGNVRLGALILLWRFGAMLST